MDDYLSLCAKRLQPSATLLMAQKSAEMREQGIDIINMSVGEPDFPTPQPIKDAAIEAIRNNVTTYSPVPGYMALREEIARKLERENQLEYAASQIIVSNGAKQCVSNAIMALINEGDEVIIPAPYWVSYPQMVLVAGGTPVTVDTCIETDFKMTPEELERAITPQTRLLILCSPSNPTGTVYSQEEMDGLAEVLRRHPQVWVIADEIYEHIRYVKHVGSIVRSEGMKERCMLVNGVSKAYSMTGWRIGYMAAPEPIVKACTKLQGQTTSGPCSISQMAALAAYRGSQDCVEEMRATFERRKQLIVSLAREIPHFEVNDPEGAFYIFPKVSHFFGRDYSEGNIVTGADFSLFLLQEAHVATVGGDAFGAPEHIRMSYATSDEHIIEALHRIAEAVESIRRS